MKILVVDDEKNIQKLLADIIKDNGWQPFVAGDIKKAKNILHNEMISVILLDVNLEYDGQGIDFLDYIKNNYEYPPEIIIITGYGNIDLAVSAIKKGAYDFIEKPPSIERIILAIEHALEKNKMEKEKLLSPENNIEFIGNSKHTHHLKKLIKTLADSKGSVLITGESGVGKELFARNLHFHSSRNAKPFIVVNSAAIPEELIEAELFGYEKGAFTNAYKMKRGKFELANEGTIFLDEIGDMSLKTQAKILRTLQDKKIERLGAEKVISIDVRVITATNKDLKTMVKEGTFREDLFYRLNVIETNIKPLRQRKDDIIPIFKYFIKVLSREYGKKEIFLEQWLMDHLVNYRWQGNIRELKNFAEKMVIFSQEGRINEEIIQPLDDTTKEMNTELSFNEAKIEFERYYIKKALKKYDQNISKTAEKLGLDRSNFFKKLKKLGITIENSKDSN